MNSKSVLYKLLFSKEKYINYQTSVGFIRLNKASISEVYSYPCSKELLISKHMENFNEEDFYKLAIEFSIMDKYKVFCDSRQAFKIYYDEIITEFIDRIFTHKDIEEMYNLIVGSEV